MSLTREAELALLIAEQEQEAKYGDHINYSREKSLDAPLGDDDEAGTLAEVVGDNDEELARLLGENETWTALVKHKQATDQDVSFWRYLRRQGWTQAEIAEHVGVSKNTVGRYLKRRGQPRPGTVFLTAKLPVAKAAYEAGAYLWQIADELYKEAGYSTHWSCYQRLRELFVEHGIPRRPGRWVHGHRSKGATPEEYQAYCREKNRVRVEQHRATLTQCGQTTKRGRRCRRWALAARDDCVVHAGLAHHRKWPPEIITAALIEWARSNGKPPRAHDWTHATEDHPNFKTVYDVFGSWPAALAAACLSGAETRRA